MTIPFQITKTLRPSILALVTNSIGMPITTMESNDVLFFVLKFVHSSSCN